MNLFFSIPYRSILMCTFSLTVLLFLSFDVASQENSILDKTNESVMPKSSSDKSNMIEKSKEAEEVEISVKAPQAYYIMSRSNFNYENVGISESFIPKIIKSVDEKPF